MAEPRIVDPFTQVNEAATQPAVVDPYAPGYEKPKGPLARGVSAATKGIAATAAGTGALVADAARATGASAAALEAARAQNEAAARDTMRVEDVDSFGSGLDFLQYAAGYLGTQLGTSILGGGVGRALGAAGARAVGAAGAQMAAKHAGTVAGLAGTSLMQEVGSIYPEAIEHGVADPMQRALVGGAVAAAADVLPQVYLAKRVGALGRSGRGAGAAREAAKVGAGEVGTELFQTYVERAASGVPVTGEEAASDYLNAGVLALLGGGTAGAVAGAYANARDTVERNDVQPAPPSTDIGQPPADVLAPVEAPAPTPFETYDATGPGNEPTTTGALQLVDPPTPSTEIPAQVEPLAKDPGYSGEPPVIIGGLEVHPGGPQIIVDRRPGAVPGFQQSAEDLIAQRAQPTPQLEIPTVSSTSPRQRIRKPDVADVRGETMTRVEAFANERVATLPFRSEKTAVAVNGALKRATEKALAGSDGTVAKQAVLDQTRRLLKGKIPAAEVDRVATELDTTIGELRLESKDAVESTSGYVDGEGNPFSDEQIYGGPRHPRSYSTKAEKATAKARGASSDETHRTAALAHELAAARNDRAGNKLAVDYHQSMARQHREKITKLPEAPSGGEGPSLLSSRDATVQQVDTMLTRQGQLARGQVEAIVGTPENLRVTTYLSDRGAGAIRLGQLRDVIEVNLAAKDVLSVANHEAFHYLEYRVLPKPDLDAVKRAFRPGTEMYTRLIAAVRAKDVANGTNLEAEVRGVPAEARAYAFQLWNNGELAAQGVVERAFRAIKRVIERIQNWVHGSGFTSYEDVFDAVSRGYYAQRRGSLFEGTPLDVPAPIMLASKDSLAELAARAHAGEIPRIQINARIAELLDDPDVTGDLRERFVDRAREEARGSVGSFKRAYLSNISSGENLARHSAGYRNVFGALTAYAQRKNRLVADGVEKQLSKWVKGAESADKEAVSKALLERTVNAYEPNSPQYDTIRGRLTPYQREMFDQATDMIATRLEDEFTADQAIYGRVLGADTAEYATWFQNRRAQVDTLKRQGYFPERRYGDHVTHVYIEGSNGKRITLYYSQHEREADARLEERELARALATEPGVKVEYGYRYRADYDGSLSFQQFLDMAGRHGIAISQGERERLAKALVAADSVRRNRLFRRKNVAGYSEDGMRVLAEFGVAMANKIAYHELGGAINDAIAGREVKVAFDRTGAVQVQTTPDTDLWAADGPMGNYFRNLSDQTADFVLSPRSGNRFSRALRGLASVHFLGGSVAAGMVQLTSMAMNTTPWLTQYTGYTDAVTRAFAGYKTAMTNHKALTDLPTLLNDNVKIEGVDDVEGLRHALQVAAQDGTTLDTEIYQIMGLSRGQEYSFSGGVQKAIKAWMTPFRVTEQWNRTGTFIAAFKLAKDQKKTSEEAYKFAQETVYATQFRYDEANRPALARGDVGSLLFVFKTYPIFLMETLTHLAKVSPSAAVTMLVTLTVMAGVEGLPFAEDIEDIIDTVAQRLFNSPFNTKRALRNVLKNASEAVVGTDLSGVMMHGIANELTGLSFASRVGLGNLIPGTRFATADADYKRTMAEILGPVGTIVQGGVGGAGALLRGEFTEAAKQALPLAGQNLIKGWEQWQRGYASDIGGRKLVDVGGWEAFWQSVGFSSSALVRAYEADRIDKQTVAFYRQAHEDFMKDIVRAAREGDTAALNDITETVRAWNGAHPEMPILLSPEGVRRQLQLSGLPMNQRTMLTLPRALRGSSEYVLGLEDR